MKRYCLPLFLLLAVIFSACLAYEGAVFAAELDISAQCAVLLDQHTARLLYARNPHEKRPMASTTKIMTAIIALEKGNLSDVIKVSERATAVGGSSIWLEAGEEKTLEELLYGLILRSGNDAAAAIAEHLGGSIEEFAEMMTAKAREIGAVNTSFKNPHGLDQEGHYTTAYDLALIMRYGLENPKFCKLMTTKEKIISWPGHEWDRFLRSQNRLLDMYPGADGGKTGWTTPAGRCFVGSATREGWQLISVVLNAPRMWEDTVALLDYGFENFDNKELIKDHQYLKGAVVEGGTAEKVGLVAMNSFAMPLRPGEERNLRYRFEVSEPISAPVKEGEIMGELFIYLEGELMGNIPLLAQQDVEKKYFLKPLIDLFKR